MSNWGEIYDRLGSADQQRRMYLEERLRERSDCSQCERKLFANKDGMRVDPCSDCRGLRKRK